jgi:hypothetical protein
VTKTSAMSAAEVVKNVSPVVLPARMREHLWQALEQMDRFQQTQDSDDALEAMIAMLRHLRVVRRYVA